MLSRDLCDTGRTLDCFEVLLAAWRVVILRMDEQSNDDRRAAIAICAPSELYLPEIASSAQFPVLPSHK
jgi:hypothetical protein